MNQPEQEDLEERVTELESRLSKLEKIINDGEEIKNPIGMREFVQKVDPDTHTERALAIAYYLDQYQGQESFSSGDIEAGYRTCRVKKPANISDTVSNLVDNNWAMDDGNEGRTRLRRLTNDGLNKIEEVLEDGTQETN